ncbi:protein-export chaperone SecB [Salibaculum sp.]|uniref:protein-export chaperone SecB n=1 Tax=Salibaculum sp. TaxID=2855480 RepID=UPI002B480234|nr:protein-export chaperone SecB [Salibaculum sp.]HKL69099.1 protein-export chaperone SecB [Salibaculum sp.]
MAENENGAAEDTSATQQQAPQIKNKILAQYTRDISFENVMAQNGVDGEIKPEIKVEVSLDGRKRATENQYEVITKMKVTSTNQGTDKTLFLLELEYAGIFQVEGVPDDQLHPFLLIECPRQTFPFVRRIVSDVTRDGGFPPLNLEQIDFLALYRQQIAQRQQQQQQQQSDA